MGRVENISREARTDVEVIRIGEYLKRKLVAINLPASALADDFGVHAQTIYNVTTGKRQISSNLALRLARRFTEPVEFWLSETVEVPRIRDIPFTANPMRSDDSASDPLREPPPFSEQGAPDAPSEQARAQDTDDRILRVAARLDRAVKDLFRYKQVDHGFKAEAAGLGLTHVGATLDAAGRRAVIAFLDALKTPQWETEEALAGAVRDALDFVTLDEADTSAIIQRFGVLDPAAIDAALKRFAYRGDRQTLYDTLGRLRLKPVACLIALIE